MSQDYDKVLKALDTAVKPVSPAHELVQNTASVLLSPLAEYATALKVASVGVGLLMQNKKLGSLPDTEFPPDAVAGLSLAFAAASEELFSLSKASLNLSREVMSILAREAMIFLPTSSHNEQMSQFVDLLADRFLEYLETERMITGKAGGNTDGCED